MYSIKWSYNRVNAACHEAKTKSLEISGQILWWRPLKGKYRRAIALWRTDYLIIEPIKESNCG